jgi:PPOX class probable F420-dependent enzyme
MKTMTTPSVNGTTEMTGSLQHNPREAKRGDLTLLEHPVARQLLHSRLPARLAYIARDGTPRVVPMQFHWTGEEVVLSCWPDDPKAAAIEAHPQVALTIDTAEPPFKVLQIRGTAAVSIVDGVSAEMQAASIRYMGQEAGQAWVEQSARLSPQTVRIAIRPTWVDVLDFETRLPGGMVRRLRAVAR